MLYGICNIMFFGSVIEEVAKNYIANKEIRNKGYNILEDDRDYLKKGIDFIKDYIYLIVPFYNIYRGTKGRLFESIGGEIANGKTKGYG